MQIQAAINKGAGVKTERKNSNFNMRVPSDFLLEIDTHIELNHRGFTRNGWILEAMKEKMEREHG